MEIRADRQVLDTYSKQSLVLERSNPAIEFAVLEGAKTYNIQLPNTPRNIKALNYSYNDTNAPSAVTAAITAGGSLVQEGTLQIKRVFDKDITVSFQQVLNQMFIDYPQTLSSLLTSTTVKPVTPSVTPAAGDLFCFPKMNNPGYFGSNSYSGIVNKHNGTTYDLTSPLVPCFFIKKLFATITLATGIEFVGSFFTDSSLDNLILINQKDVNSSSSIVHGDHVPEMTIPVFLKELSLMLNLVIYIGRRQIKIDIADSLFTQPGKKVWFEPKVIGKNHFTKNRLILEHSPSDAYTKDVLDYTTFLSNPSNIIDNFSLKTSFSTVDYDTGFARIDAKGVSTVNNQSNEKNTFKIAFYDSGTANHTLGTRSLKLIKAGVSLPNSFWAKFDRHIANTFEIEVQMPTKPFQAAELDFHENGGQNMSIFIRDHHFLITKQRIDLVNEIGDFTLQKITI